MPSRLCITPTCPNPATYRGRCQRHARQRDKQIQRAGKQVYNTRRWKVVRTHYLFNHPLCECDDPTCFLIAEHVHHVKDLADGGAPFDQANLQALSASCHSRITRANQQGSSAHA